MPEQRRHPRINVDLPVRYRSDAVSLDGRACDLSQDGLFFVSSYLDEPGGEIAIELDLPDSDVPLRLSGEVRWIDEAPLHAGMGIRFVNVAITERLRLANFVIHRTYRSF
jgi:uncharacterized protein (TIGR02266 family)